MDLLNTLPLFPMLLIFIGAFVQTAIGFGLAVVAAPLLFVISPDYVPGPIVFVALFISLLGTVKNRQCIEIGGLKMALLGRVPGSVLGGLMLSWISATALSLWLGLLVLLAVLISLMPVQVHPTPARMGMAGFFSGFLGTSSSIGGPPMALLLQHQEAKQLRGNLAAFFVFSSALSLMVLAFTHHLTVHHIWLTLPLIPAAGLGAWLAMLTTHSLSKRAIRTVALLLCTISGIVAVAEAL